MLSMNRTNKDLGDEVRISTSVNLATFAAGLIERATAVGENALDFTGNKAANILIGNSAINILDGAAGADILKGGAGSDIYYIDAATDKIDEGINKDSADEVRSTVAVNLTTLGKGQIEIATLLGTKAVAVTGNLFDNLITGNSGANALNGGGANDTLIGADGNDTIVDKIGHNSLKGGNGNDTLTSGSGNDRLDGGLGIDVMAGGTGDDTYFVDDLKDKVTDSGTKDLNDSVVASISIDLTKFAGGLLEHVTLIGDADLQAIGNNRDNTLIGNDGDNLLLGGLGNDSLDGGQGADTMQGGAGNDSYVVDAIGDVVDEQGNSDVGDTIRTALSIDLVTFANGAIEHAELTGAATDTFGNAANNLLAGNNAANTLDGREGNDTLLGNGGADFLIGGVGSDVLDGGTAFGSDTLRGGSGNDVYYLYNSFDDDVVDEEGNDDTADEVRVTFWVDLSTLAGGAIENATALGTGFVQLTGNAGANILVSNGHNSKLDGGAGDDVLIGGDGSDSYVIDSAGDVIVEKLANAVGDTVYTSALSLDLATLSNGNLENVTLWGDLDLDIVGNATFNTLNGNDGDNKIDGGAGNDNLSGGEGNDYIIAGDGHDYVNGDGGDDVLVALPRVAMRIAGGTGIDTLLLAMGSKIDLRPNAGGFGSFIDNIEIIDVRNGGRDDLQFDEASLRSMSSSTDQLIVRGEVGDIVRLGTEFIDQGGTTIDGVSYSILASNGATLLIESGIELREEAAASSSLKDAVQIHGKGADALGMYAAAAGDFNNDGTDDLVFGALQGNAWVAFGSTSGYPQDIATHPFDVPGVTISGDGLIPVGYEVAGGNDINGDGIADILVQNPGEIVSGQLRGGAFVVFGSSSLSSLDLNSMTSANGFKVTASAAVGKALGSVSTVADFNGDGYDDFLVGAPGYGSGQAYLVLGRASSPGGSIALAPGNGVFQITGKNAASFGQNVSDAGDLNGDGYNDIVISGANQTEIIYGRKGSTMPSFANGANSAVLNWAYNSSQSLGDINGDGYNDLVLIQSNLSVVLFGKGTQFTTSSLNEIKDTESIRVEGLISFAGDINADGYDDVIVRNAGGLEADAAVVMYGHSGSFDHWVSFPMLNENAILRITPDDPSALTYLATAAGDTDGDGFDDILVGNPYSKADPESSGILYQIAGRDFRDEVDILGTTKDDSLTGAALGERIVAAQGNDLVIGGGGADVINAGQGNDEIHVGDNQFFRIDGGAGVDTLHLDYAGAIDFGNLDGKAATSDRGRISNVETLDVANGYANAMTLHLADVLDLDVTVANVGGKASLDNVLRIDGEAGDTLQMFKADGWSSGQHVSLWPAMRSTAIRRSRSRSTPTSRCR